MSDDSEKPAKKKSNVSRIFIGIAIFGFVGIVATLAMRFTLFIPFKVPSGSMWPGVAVGDHIVVNGMDKEAVRGAAMVFKYPEQPRQLFLKRVVGLSGDVIEVKSKVVTINGWDVPHCVVGDASYEEAYETNMKHSGELWVEFLDGTAYLVFHEKNGFGIDHQGPFTVKRGEYFVLGDNRENAHDSRMWNNGMGGGVPFDNTTGRVRADPTHPKLPKGSEGLQSALDRCLATPPPVTSPPSATQH